MSDKTEDRMRYESYNKRWETQSGDLGLQSKWQTRPTY